MKVIILIILQLLAASAAPTNPDLSNLTYPRLVAYRTIFGKEPKMASNDSELLVNLEILNEVMIKYPERTAGRPIDLEEVDQILGPKSCEINIMRVRLATGLLILDDHPDRGRMLKEMFANEINKCIGRWFHRKQIGGSRISALGDAMRAYMAEQDQQSNDLISVDSEGEEEDDDDDREIDCLNSEYCVLKGLQYLGRTSYGDYLLSMDDGLQPETELGSRFCNELKLSLVAACESFITDWCQIGEPWLRFAAIDEYPMYKITFTDFILKYKACKTILVKKEYLQYLETSKLTSLARMVTDSMNRELLTPEQTRTIMKILFTYRYGIIFPKRDFQLILGLTDHRRSCSMTGLVQMTELLIGFKNPNLTNLVNHAIDEQYPMCLEQVKTNLLESVAHINVSDPKFEHLDKLIENMDRKRERCSGVSDLSVQIVERDIAASLDDLKNPLDSLNPINCFLPKNTAVNTKKTKAKYNEACSQLYDADVTRNSQDLNFLVALKPDIGLLRNNDVAVKWAKRALVCYYIMRNN